MKSLLKTLQKKWNLVHHGTMSRTPLYHQLYCVLKASILDGSIPFDAKMPTESQLSTIFDVSRITAKRAMDELAGEYLIARYRGRGSYVVHESTPHRQSAPLVSMPTNLAEMSRRSTVQVLSSEKAVPPGDIQEILGLDDDDAVLVVTWLSSNENNEPYAYLVSFTAGIEKSIGKRSLERKSRIEILHENGIVLAVCEQAFSARDAYIEIAEKLDVDVGAALLSIRRISRDGNGAVVDVVDGLYNPDRYKFAMDVSPGQFH